MSGIGLFAAALTWVDDFGRGWVYLALPLLLMASGGVEKLDHLF